jgi:hypothetical protein
MCFGQLRAYTADPDDPRRELWLHPVAESTDPEAGFKEVPGLSVYVPADQIVSVSAYRPQDRTQTDEKGA